MSKLTKYRNQIRIGVAAVVLGAVGVGGFTVVNGLAVARADHQAQVAAAAEDDAEQSAMEQDMYAAADAAKKAQDAADEAAYQQFLADKAAAEAKAAADAKAAEDARIAAEAQAAADAAAKATTKAPVKRSASGGGGGGAGSPGSPIPFVSDPNEAGGGHYDTTQCDSGSGSTINGVPTCD